MSEPVIVSSGVELSTFGVSGVFLIGGEAILLLFFAYGLFEWGHVLLQKLKEKKTSLFSAKMQLSLLALAASLVPTLFGVLYIRFKPFDYNADMFISLGILLTTLVAGFVLQAVSMVYFFKKMEKIES